MFVQRRGDNVASAVLHVLQNVKAPNFQTDARLAYIDSQPAPEINI